MKEVTSLEDILFNVVRPNKKKVMLRTYPIPIM